ncbi:MAG: hypothetical protein GF364_10890 [Candidatus Lokiarchaeota archaeon]|nr:hypothetical protein [Candidatus Lokiarchaeota archaeon]
MVSDTTFYIVLGILLALVAFIVFFFIYLSKKMPSPLMMRILTTLHAALFGYETALVDLIGTRGYRTHVFPEVVKVMNSLKNDTESMKGVFGAKDAHEAMERWIKIMESADIASECEVLDKGDDTYQIVIGKCSMSYPIHEVMGQKKGICPLALIVSSAINIVDEDSEPVIAYSEFTPDGTKTTLRLKKVES